MKSLLAKGACAAAVCAAVALTPSSASAAAGKVTVVHLRGPLVNALFSSTDATGCVSTEVFVSANSGTEQDQPGTTHYAVASVQIYQYDACTDTTLLDATGLIDTLPADAFQVSQQVDQASLHAAIVVSDLVSGDSSTVNVDVSWAGIGDLVRNHSNTNDNFPGCHIINRWKGTGRDATAAGTVSDGASNFIPTSSDSAEIGYVIDGFEIMGCS